MNKPNKALREYLMENAKVSGDTPANEKFFEWGLRHIPEKDGVSWKKLFKVKNRSNRKGSEQRSKYDVIRIRDGVKIARNVTGRNKVQRVIAENYNAEKKKFDKELEKILLSNE